MARKATEIEVGGRRVRITHPDKILFPQDGITKAQFVDYHVRIAETMLPHVRGRPMTQQRFHQGIAGPGVWVKQAANYFPDWIDRVAVETYKGPQQQVVCNEPATLAYLANQDVVTPHVFLSRADRLGHPDLLVFDLDPITADLAPVRDGARTLRSLVADLGLVPFVKTSGSKGLHVTVPLDRTADYDAVRGFAEEVAAWLVERDERFTLEFRKAKRRGRVLVDVARNGYGATVVPPYAVRARPGAPVATPIEWDEVGRIIPTRFTLRNVFRCLGQRGDPWADIDRHARPLREATKATRAFRASRAAR